MTKLIERGTTTRMMQGQTFTRIADNQPGVLIQSVEGERMMTKDSDLLGKVYISAGSHLRHCHRLSFPFQYQPRVRTWSGRRE